MIFLSARTFVGPLSRVKRLAYTFGEFVSETGETLKGRQGRQERGREERVDAQVDFEGNVASNNSGTVFIQSCGCFVISKRRAGP